MTKQNIIKMNIVAPETNYNKNSLFTQEKVSSWSLDNLPPEHTDAKYVTVYEYVTFMDDYLKKLFKLKASAKRAIAMRYAQTQKEKILAKYGLSVEDFYHYFNYPFAHTINNLNCQLTKKICKDVL